VTGNHTGFLSLMEQNACIGKKSLSAGAEY